MAQAIERLLATPKMIPVLPSRSFKGPPWGHDSTTVGREETRPDASGYWLFVRSAWSSGPKRISYSRWHGTIPAMPAFVTLAGIAPPSGTETAGRTVADRPVMTSASLKSAYALGCSEPEDHRRSAGAAGRGGLH